MEVKDLQKQVNEFVDVLDEKFKCKHNTNNTFIHLIEEIGELAKQVNSPNIRNEEIDKNNLAEELGDILILTIRLASENNIDVEQAIKDKIEMLKKRHNLSR